MKKSIFLFFAAILCSMSIDAYAATQRYIYVGLSNNYHKWKDASQWGINHWGGTGGGVVPGSKITDLKTTFTHSGCTFHMYRMYVYDDNKNFEFKGSDNWWDCKKENISISGTTKNALLFRDNDGGDGGSPTLYQTNYQEESAVSLSASSNSVSVGEEVILTPKLTSNAEYNEIASTTYSVGTGATVSDGKFVATTAGTYTVTATITYNPKKFTGITKKVENITCEIVVSEVAIPHPVTGVTVAPTSVTIKQGATATLTATVSPSNADDPSITWSSDNTSVATVVNGVVTAVAAGTANITVTTVDGGFTATCAVKVKPSQYTFHAINSAQWPTVAAHYWGGADGGSSWPGADMVKESETINGFDIYSITISSDFVNIMFTNQIDGDKNKKTADLTTEGNDGKYYDIKEAKWYASLSEVPVSYDYYLAGSMNGWATNNANYGMALVDDVYKKELEFAKDAEFKVTNGTDWYGFADVDSKYQGVSDKDGNIKVDAAATFTVVFNKTTKKITFDGLTKIEDYYTVVGSSDELGLAWDPTKKANDMEKQDDGSYKKVYSNVELTTSVEWKIAKNGAWWNDTPLENKADNGNSVLTISKSGIYNVTFTLSKDLKTAHAEAELLEETNTVADCFVSGNAALTGGAGWAGNEFKMEYDDVTKTYSYTLTGLATDKAYELKVVLGGAWHSYADLASVPTGVTKGNDDAIAFKMAEAGDVTVKYNVEAGITLSGNFALPVTYDYYIAGTLAGGWSATQQGMTKDGDVYKHTFLELSSGIYQFKITDGQFNTEEDKTHEHTTLAAEYKEVSYVDGNIQINTEEAINLTVIFNATANKITLEGLTIVTHTYTIAGDAALCGEAWNWELESNDMTNNGDGTYTWTKAGVEVNGELSFKVYVDHKSEPAYPAENWVIKPENYEGVGVYDVTITFTESSKEIAVVLTKQGVVTPTPDYTRTVTAGDYGTICLPFGSSNYTGMELYEFVGCETGKAYIASVTTLEAGVPYIFRATASELAVYSDGTTATEAGSNNGLHGTFTDDTPVAVDNYILYQNAICKVTAICWVNANRAYIVWGEIPTGAPQQMPGRKYIGMDVTGENEATGFENITNGENTTIKVIENGQLIIIRNGEKFNAQGVRL